MFGLSNSTIRSMQQVLEKFPEVEKAQIFGSRAMGNEKPGSDIDIALFGVSLKPEIVHQVFVELEERLPLPYRFDVVGYEHLSDEAMKKHIDDHGVLIYPKR